MKPFYNSLILFYFFCYIWCDVKYNVLKIKYLILLFFINPCLSISQDTAFLAKHNFPTPVRNVVKAGDDVYAKTGNGFYKHTGEGWELLESGFKKTYVFYDNDFFEADYLISQFTFYAEGMAHLIPQVSLTNGTIAKKGNHLFVSVGGSLFEYIINPFYQHTYQNYSIRDIFLEDNLSIISTYNGIFINDSIKAEKPSYSNGSLCKIGGRYFLCSDKLFEFTRPSNFTQINEAESVSAGLIRKIIQFGDKIYTQNTRTINLFDTLAGLRTLHDGYEYFDLEVFNNNLIFSTSTGEVLSYNNGFAKQLFDINTRIRDIYPFRELLYFATDLGVYTLKNEDPTTLTRIAELPFSVKVQMDKANNLWVATENGLFVIPDKQIEPIAFVQNVEFNRGALTLYNDTLYAGSIDGLYIIDTYKILKNYIPQFLNKKSIYKFESWRILITTGIALLLMSIAYGIYYFKFKKIGIPLPNQKEKKVLTLEQIEIDINTNNITSVEALADFYTTNPVQLNRLFKTYDTTPGKFLKKVKLNIALNMLKKGTPMEDVVAQTGYTAHYIKQHLLK
jgi:hypothetical protein